MSLLDKLKPTEGLKVEITEPLEPKSKARPRFRLSHSSADLLQRCEKKYQLQCTMPEVDEDIRMSIYPDLSFGKAVGAGFEKYLETGDLDAALFTTLLEYQPLTEDPTTKQNRKYLERAFFCVEALAIKWEEAGYELLHFDGRPAIELTFKVVLNDYGDYYCGAMDLGLWNPKLELPGVGEIKTTGLNRDDLTPIYKYSPQTLGYSMVLDVITSDTPANFENLYFVAHLKRGEEWPTARILPFTKTRLDRMNWLMTLLMDLNQLIQCWEQNFWPQRFQECLAFNRPCQYLDTCNMSSWNEEQEVLGNEFGLHYNAGKDWEFEFHIKDLFGVLT